MHRIKSLFLLLSVLILLVGSGVHAQDDGLKLTGWPYEVDVVTENLGRFTEQMGHDAVFLPFPSNEYHDKMVASFVAGTELMSPTCATATWRNGRRPAGSCR